MSLSCAVLTVRTTSGKQNVDPAKGKKKKLPQALYLVLSGFGLPRIVLHF
jgi:hypothetical protein